MREAVVGPPGDRCCEDWRMAQGAGSDPGGWVGHLDSRIRPASIELLRHRVLGRLGAVVSSDRAHRSWRCCVAEGSLTPSFLRSVSERTDGSHVVASGRAHRSWDHHVARCPSRTRVAVLRRDDCPSLIWPVGQGYVLVQDSWGSGATGNGWPLRQESGLAQEWARCSPRTTRVTPPRNDVTIVSWAWRRNSRAGAQVLRQPDLLRALMSDACDGSGGSAGCFLKGILTAGGGS